MSEGVLAGPLEVLRERRRRHWAWGLWGRLFREKPLGALGAVMVIALSGVALLADVIAPYGYNDTFFPHRLEAPSAAFWFGTDNIARDVLSRVVHGARIAMIWGVSP